MGKRVGLPTMAVSGFAGRVCCLLSGAALVLLLACGSDVAPEASGEPASAVDRSTLTIRCTAKLGCPQGMFCFDFGGLIGAAEGEGHYCAAQMCAPLKPACRYGCIAWPTEPPRVGNCAKARD